MINELNLLWKEVSELSKELIPKNTLKPIFGAGKNKHPKFMFLFINPTKRNISSNPDWRGIRAPFIGTKNIWKIFNKAGLFDGELMKSIEYHKKWSCEFANDVYRYLEGNDFYLTNIVKSTGDDASLPKSKEINLFLPLLKREIEIVKPRYIICFGLIPFNSLIKEKIRLSNHFDTFTKTRELISYDLNINSFKTKVIPCYFPVGRGNPKRAIELLKFIKNLD